MVSHELEPLDRFHAELRAVTNAGVRLDIGHDARATSLTEELDRIHAALSVRVSLNQSLEAAIREEQSLPDRYRAAALAWIRFEEPAEVLDALFVDSQRHDGVIRGLRMSLLQMSVWLMLVCLGLAVASLWLSPRIDRFYEDLRVPPTASAQWLSAARQWLPVWTTVAAVGFLLFCWGICLTSGTGLWRMSRWLPMVRRRERFLRQARFAHFLSTWLRQDMPTEEGKGLAAAFSGLGPPSAARQPDGSGGSLVPATVPPLVTWALTGDVVGEPRWAVLRNVSEVYRRLADRQVTWWARSIPVDFVTIVGGFAVLLYGLSILLPVFGLLHDIAVTRRP